jgi:hypothetical protein
MDTFGTALDLQHIDQALEEVHIQEAREDFVAFCEYVMIDEMGKSWKCPRHQKEWGECLFGPQDLSLIIAPRSHAKSTTVAASILFDLGRNPDTCIKYICGDDNLAMDKLQFIKANIQSNLRYKKVFPHIRPALEGEWTKHKLFIERPSAHGLQDASLEAAGVTSSGTGGRAHKIIFDDIIDSDKAIMRPAFIATIKRLVEEDWLNLLYPDGKANMIGTFWSFDPPDIYVEYSERPEWNPWIKPACGLSADGRLIGPVLWESKWHLKALEKRRQQIGDVAFMQQFLLRGVVGRTSLFSDEHVSECKDRKTAIGETPPGFEIAYTVMGVDPAASLRKTGSYSAIYVTAISTDGRKMPVSIVRGRWTPEVVATTIIEQQLLWNCRVILVENNATQEILVSLVKVLGEKYGMTEIPVKGRFTGETKWSPDAGLPKVNAELAQVKWIIPFGGDHSTPMHNCYVCDWLQEMKWFGKPRMPNGRPPTTDIIMSWWLSSTAADTSGQFGDLPIIGASDRRSVSFGGTRYSRPGMAFANRR